MKVLVLLFLFQICLFPQFKDEYSPEVLKFKMAVEKIATKYTGISIHTEIELNDEQFSKILKIYYDAVSKDPEGFIKCISNENKERDIKISNNLIKTDTWGFISVLSIINNTIREKYSDNYLRIFKTPYFFKVKLVSKENKTFTLKDRHLSFQTHFTGVIEEIIKGNDTYKKGELINFMYVDHAQWMHENNFKVGDSYFIPFRILTKDISQFEGLNNQFYTINCESYLIDNEKIFMAGNFFGLGEEANWESFKNEFIKVYLLNK